MSNQLTEKITGDEKRNLLSLCLIAAKETGFLLHDETDLHGDRLLKLYKDWGGDGWAQNFKPIAQSLQLEDAAVNFKDFLKAKQGEFAKRLQCRELKLTELSVTFSVPLGERGMINYTAKGIPPEDADKEEMQDMFQWLLHQTVFGYEQQINRPLQLPTKNKYQAQSGDTANTFEFTSIRMASSEGKRGFFCKGIPYVKWGVRVFPNVLSAAGIDPEKIDGEAWIAGTAIYTKKANGDPDLVVSIQKGTTQL